MPRIAPAHSRLRIVWITALLLALALVSCWKVDADLVVSTNQIDFSTTKETNVITITNDSQDNALTSGVVTLEYKLKSDASWLTVTPASGACGAMEKQSHTVAVDRSRMVLGENLGNISITSNGGSATIKVRAVRSAAVCYDGPGAPVVLSPVSGATDVAANADLTWTEGESKCPGLTATYDVYFGTTSPPPFDHDNDSLKVWNPGPLAKNTAYYWRVVVKDANGETRGPQWTFHTVCDLGPSNVTLLLPADNATGVAVNGDISWSGGVSQCAGLSSTYDVYFGTTSPAPLQDNTTLKYWVPGLLARGTTYYWKIVAKDAHGTNVSAERSFTTAPAACTLKATDVVLLSPADQSTDVPLDQNLSWSGGDSQCAGMTATYDVYFGTVSPAPLDHNNGTSKTWDPGLLQYDTVYYWRIVAKDGNGSRASNEYWFRTPCHLTPGALTVVSPLDHATGVGVDANLSWGGGNSRCPGLSSAYDVYFGKTSPPPFVANNGSLKYWDPGTLTQGGTYYWKIVAKDANGQTSGPVWTFTTAPAVCTLKATDVVLLAPNDQATDVPIDQDLSWSGGDSQCAGLTATYDVYFGTTSPAPLDHNNGTSKTWDPGQLQYDTLYYWRIVAKDDNGFKTSEERSFRTPCHLTPGALTVVSPLDHATGVGVDANLSWSGGNSRCPGLSSTYDVYFGTTSSPPFVENNGSLKGWDPGTLTQGVTYYWKIVAKDANGETAGPVWTFRTEEPPCTALPTAACGPSPPNNKTNVNRDQNLAWSCGDSQCGLAVTYDVYLGTSATLGDAQKLGTTASKSWTLPRLQGLTKYYWKVITRDANGVTSSPVWSFTTKS